MEEFERSASNACPKCGTPADEDARFCKYCSQSLTLADLGLGPEPEIDSGPSRRAKPVFIATGVVAILVAIAAIAIVVFQLRNRAEAPAQTDVAVAPAVPTLGDKARQIEHKILNGEVLNASNLEGLSAQELRVLRNVHFARYGRKYERPGLGDYFFTQEWYKPSESYSDSMITSLDKENISLILKAEEMMKNGSPITSAYVQTTPEPTPLPLNRNELTRDLVLSLLSGYRRDIHVSLGTVSFTMSNKSEIYTQMINAKILSCQWKGDRYYHCRPGTKGSAFYQSEQEVGESVSGSLSLIVGRKAPSVVTGISQLSQAVAQANVEFSFEPNSSYDVYQRWSAAFYRPPDTRTEVHRAVLQLYDDGWRVERVD